jgi:hypothetical protein
MHFLAFVALHWTVSHEFKPKKDLEADKFKVDVFILNKNQNLSNKQNSMTRCYFS